MVYDKIDQLENCAIRDSVAQSLCRVAQMELIIEFLFLIVADKI